MQPPLHADPVCLPPKHHLGTITGGYLTSEYTTVPSLAALLHTRYIPPLLLTQGSTSFAGSLPFIRRGGIQSNVCATHVKSFRAGTYRIQRRNPRSTSTANAIMLETNPRSTAQSHSASPSCSFRAGFETRRLRLL